MIHIIFIVSICYFYHLAIALPLPSDLCNDKTILFLGQLMHTHSLRYYNILITGVVTSVVLILHLAVSTSSTDWSMLSRTHVPSQVDWLVSTSGSIVQTLVLVLVAGHGPVVVGWLQVDHVDHMLSTIQNITSYDLFLFSKTKLHTHTALIINISSA